MAEIQFGNEVEKVVTREEFPVEKALEVMKGRKTIVLGYGSQGPGQAQNQRDQGFDVIVGQRPGSASWTKALEDGWVPGENLFDIEDALKRGEAGDVVANLLSDAAQMLKAEDVYKYMVPGQTAYFSHGFGPHFSDLTGINIPKGVNSVMVAPKGAGMSVRKNFLKGSGINSSYAVQTDATGDALDTTLAVGIGVGSGYLFETTMAREVVSDHFGERAILLGGTWALAENFYEKLRAEGQSPEEAFVNSSEQLTQVIYPMIGSGGIEELLAGASEEDLQTVANYREAYANGLVPVLSNIYNDCRSGVEAKRSLDTNSKEGYREGLNQELNQIRSSEMSIAGENVRSGERDYSNKPINYALAGAVLGFIDSQSGILLRNRATPFERTHTSSEAFNETVEELTQSLNQFYQAKGVAHLLEVCSTTAQRGALDRGPEQLDAMRRIKVVKYNKPITFDDTIWGVGETVRSLRPENVQYNV